VRMNFVRMVVYDCMGITFENSRTLGLGSVAAT